GELLDASLGCVPIADDCGDELPPEASEPGVAVVRPGATDGDGSAARPFGTIYEAVRSGAHTIALAPGEHVLEYVLRDVTLVGACPTSTTLRVNGLGRMVNSTLRRLRVAGSGQITVPASATLELDRVEIAEL